MKMMEMAQMILNDKTLRFRAEIEGKEIIAFANQNGGISIGEDNLRFTAPVLNADWQILNKRVTFLEAINSGKYIKHESWGCFRPISEALYDLLGSKESEVIRMINGNWNVAIF